MEKKNEGFARLDPPRPVVGEGETKSGPRAPKSDPRRPGSAKTLVFLWFFTVFLDFRFLQPRPLENRFWCPKVPPRAPKSAPRPTKTPPRAPKTPPRQALDRPKSGPRRAKSGPRRAKSHPREAKSGPRAAKSDPTSPRSGPRPTRDRPRAPKTSKRASKTPLRPPKTTKNRTKTPPKRPKIDPTPKQQKTATRHRDMQYRYALKICNRDMQSPILRLCNYAFRICPSMPGLHASMPP